MGTDSVIYIRTDGNSKIATGHFVRCLCITQALETLGKQVCFLVSDAESAGLLKDLSNSLFQGYSFEFDVKVLETAVYDDLEQELDELKYILTQISEFAVSQNSAAQTINDVFHSSLTQTEDTIFHGSAVKTEHDVFHGSAAIKPVILIDSYYVTPAYLNSLRTFAKIAYMDDLRSFDYPVDLVINYDVIPPSKTAEYDQAYTNSSVKLLGAGYTPLRSQFQNPKVSLKDEIQNILITTGGSDPYHFTETVISYLLSQNFSIDLHVVVGKLFQNTESLETLARQNPCIHLHYNVSDMAALMKQCDYAISAAGTTLYELCALGIPAISFTIADNQIIMAKTFAETRAVPYAGDLRKDMLSEILSCINTHLKELSQNFFLRQKQNELMRQLTDGNGAKKIALELYNL